MMGAVAGTLSTRVLGDGRPVLFGHGLGGSLGFWGDTFDHLAAGHRLAFVDLGGFGRSVGVGGPYDLDGHLERLAEVRRRHLDGDGLVVVGHSFGALVAIAASARWTGVAGVLGFGLPAFRSPAEALARLRNLGPMERGTGDRVCPPAVVREVLDGLAVEVRVVDGDHHLPLRRPGACVAALEQLLASRAGR